MVSLRRMRGFTIAEVMMVLVLSVIGLFGFVALQSLATNGNARARAFHEAEVLAESCLETYQQMPYANLPVGPITEPPGGQAATTLLNPLGVVDPTGPVGSYWRVTTIVPNVTNTQATITCTVFFQDSQISRVHSVNAMLVKVP